MSDVFSAVPLILAANLPSTLYGPGRHAAGMGLSASEIRAEIMQVRNLAKKGSVKRQREYTERTAGKAVRQAE